MNCVLCLHHIYWAIRFVQQWINWEHIFFSLLLLADQSKSNTKQTTIYTCTCTRIETKIYFVWCIFHFSFKPWQIQIGIAEEYSLFQIIDKMAYCFNLNAYFLFCVCADNRWLKNSRKIRKIDHWESEKCTHTHTPIHTNIWIRNICLSVVYNIIILFTKYDAQSHISISFECQLQPECVHCFVWLHSNFKRKSIRV